MDKLNVAICGGGITSLCIAYALTTKDDRWNVKIFEASSTYREESAAIGLGSNAQEALSLISPSLRTALDEARAVRMDPAARVMIGNGPERGRHVGDICPTSPIVVVHRGSFWRKLLERIPKDVLETGKRVISIDYSDLEQPVLVNLEDGTQYKADAVVGCDGINSVVRQVVLGANHPAANPVYTRGYGHRLVVPIERAVTAFGADYCNMKTQHFWIGANALVITDLLDDGTSMQIIIGGLSTEEPWPSEAPFVEWPEERLQNVLADWGDFGEAVLKIFTNQPKLYAARSRIHPETPTYCQGPICIAGDAAQSFFPTEGAGRGTGQAIEDALMLSTVLGSCSSKKDIPRALQAYDAVRRPRRSSIASSSRSAALILTGKAPGIGLNPERIAEVLPNWASGIYNYDLVAAQAKGLEEMAQK